MGSKEWLDRLRELLLRSGLPAEYVSRTVQELGDHHADLMLATDSSADECAAAAWQKLGDVEHLAAEVTRRFHARTFAGRHPLLTFVVAPIPLVLVFWTTVWIAGFMTLFGAVAPLLGWRLGQTVSEMTPLVVWTMLSCHYAVTIVPPTAAALWFLRLARRSGRGLVWATPACLLVTVLAFAFVFYFRLPYEAHQGRLGLGLGLPLPENWQRFQFFGMWGAFHVQRQALQTLPPLSVLAYALWQSHRKFGFAPPVACNRQPVAA